MNDAAGNSPARREPYSLNERIDVCRGLFALLVVTAHAFELAITLDPSWSDGMPWLVERMLAYGPGVGTYYVMGFFILSGFCIQGSVSRSSTTAGFPLGRYMAARATRILPLYYIALVFAVAVEWAIPTTLRPHVWYNNVDPQAVGCQLLMIQNLTRNFGSFSSTWSLTNEVAYYLIFGLLAAICIPARRKPAVVGMALCVGLGMTLQAIYRLGFRDVVILKAGLLIGLGAVWHLGALVEIYGPTLVQSPGVARAARLWPAGLAATMAAYGSHRFHQEFIFVAAGVTFALMMLHFIALDQRRDGQGVTAAKPVRRLPEILGLSSYPVYLFHGPILLAFGAALQALGLAPPWWAAWILAVTTAAGLCLPLGSLLEAPLLTWRSGVLKRIKTRPRPIPAPSPTLGAPASASR